MIGSILAVGHQIKGRSGNLINQQDLMPWADDRPSATVDDVLKEWGLKT